MNEKPVLLFKNGIKDPQAYYKSIKEASTKLFRGNSKGTKQIQKSVIGVRQTCITHPELGLIYFRYDNGQHPS